MNQTHLFDGRGHDACVERCHASARRRFDRRFDRHFDRRVDRSSDSARPRPTSAGAPACRRMAPFLALALLALGSCASLGSGGSGGAGSPGSASAASSGVPAGGVGLVAGPGVDLAALAATTALTLPGDPADIVRSGRYVYSHSDDQGGAVATMAEDFAVARVAGGLVGKAHLHPMHGSGDSLVIAFALDPAMRLQRLLWRCECEAPAVELATAPGQIVVTPIIDGVRQPAVLIALEHDWTLTQFQILSWAMIGSARLEVGGTRTLELIDIDQSGQATSIGTMALTRHADRPLPEPRRGEPTPQHYTAETILSGGDQAGAADGKDPPEQIWTDALGCPLLTLDEVADARHSVWRIERVPIPDQDEAPAPPAPDARSTSADPDAASASALPESPCPPAEPRPHCVLLTPRAGARARAAEFVARAARDGIEVQREGELWSAYLTDAEIVKHFGGRVVYRRVAASASNSGSGASQCNAYLEGTKIPARYARYLASVAIGHQICE